MRRVTVKGVSAAAAAETHEAPEAQPSLTAFQAPCGPRAARWGAEYCATFVGFRESPAAPSRLEDAPSSPGHRLIFPNSLIFLPSVVARDPGY